MWGKITIFARAYFNIIYIMRKFFLLFAVAATCCGFTACDDDDDSFAAISGKVSENVVSLKGGITYLGGITVELYKGEHKKTLVATKQTAADGTYVFANLGRGQYDIKFRAKEDSYAPVDTTLNLFELIPYTVNAKMHYNLERGNGLWVSNDKTLTMRLWDGMFVMYNHGGNSSDYHFKGSYNVNGNDTQLFFTDYDTSVKFDADYIGEGAIYLFLPEAIKGKSRYIFYKEN